MSPDGQKFYSKKQAAASGYVESGGVSWRRILVSYRPGARASLATSLLSLSSLFFVFVVGVRVLVSTSPCSSGKRFVICGTCVYMPWRWAGCCGARAEDCGEHRVSTAACSEAMKPEPQLGDRSFY